MAIAPSIEIVIPVCERVDFLPVAIDSAIKQGGGVQITVVDDASSHNEVDRIVKRFAHPYIRSIRCSTRLPIFAHWNRCVDLCDSEHIAFLHDDDVLLPGWRMNIEQAIMRYPSGGVYFCGSDVMDINGRTTRKFLGSGSTFPLSRRAINRLCTQNSIQCSGTVLKKSRWRQVGGYPTRNGFTGDWEFLIKMAAASPLVCVDLSLCKTRMHDGPSQATFRCLASGELLHANLRQPHLNAEILGLTDDERKEVAAAASVLNLAAAKGSLIHAAELTRPALLRALAVWRRSNPSFLERSRVRLFLLLTSVAPRLSRLARKCLLACYGGRHPTSDYEMLREAAATR